ncbi:MAG TPA: tetraacyldisaccharide 4'-kinase [Longimicrobiales bacterium]|nr:tetraacyldisaccharide 4'-kinase [Longimicrobiales bacterium]
MTFRDGVRRMWSGDAGAAGRFARALLLPAEGAFRAVTALRRAAYDRGILPAVKARIPVIGVGNLSVGGTGKTPVASWVIRELQTLGRRPALVARGYGRDELLLHRRWTPTVPVVANPDRRAGVEEAAREGATVAVLDDGFQHRRLARQLDLVLVAAEEGLPGALLPRGPFRESRKALSRAGGIVVTRKSGTPGEARGLAESIRREHPDVPVARLHLAPGGLVRLGDHHSTEVPSGPVVVATGVARPEAVAQAARALGCAVRELVAYPDHHEFTEPDMQALLTLAGDDPIVVTEKDGVKLAELGGARAADLRVIKQTLTWEEGEDAIRALLVAAVREDV